MRTRGQMIVEEAVGPEGIGHADSSRVYRFPIT